MGQSIQPQQKSWSLLPPQPRNAIPESIASSLFPSLSFSLSLSLSLSPSAQSAEIVGLPETTQEQEKRKRVAEEIPDAKHAC